MPKYVFVCQGCNVKFDRTLKMAEHLDFPCPACKQPAPRFWDGQGLAFDFADGAGTPNANSGVSKHDYPTADQGVGRSAEVRWAEVHAREEVKRKVREGGSTTGLIRKHGRANGYIEYEAMTEPKLAVRKQLVKKVQAIRKATEES